MTDTIAAVTSSVPRARTSSRVIGAVLLTTVLAMGLTACGTTDTTDTIRINKEQGTEQNIASLTAVIDANPSDPEGYNTRGSAYGRAGQFSRALDDFNRALELNPRFYQAYANRALIYRNQGQPELALADYNTALKLSPRYDVAFIGRGNIYRQAGQLDAAMNDYNRAIGLDTTDGRAYHNRGLIYQLRGNHAKAIEDFSTAISLSPNSPSPITAAAFPISR
jgi:tetratricopeptide (TPR) repeat protein